MSKTTTKTSRTAPKVAVAAKSKTAGIRSKVVGTLKNAKTMAVSVRNKTVAGAKATDKKIRQNPYKSIAVAVGAGLLAGALIGRRGRKATAAPEAAEAA